MRYLGCEFVLENHKESLRQVKRLLEEVGSKIKDPRVLPHRYREEILQMSIKRDSGLRLAKRVKKQMLEHYIDPTTSAVVIRIEIEYDLRVMEVLANVEFIVARGNMDDSLMKTIGKRLRDAQLDITVIEGFLDYLVEFVDHRGDQEERKISREWVVDIILPLFYRIYVINGILLGEKGTWPEFAEMIKDPSEGGIYNKMISYANAMSKRIDQAENKELTSAYSKYVKKFFR